MSSLRTPSEARAWLARHGVTITAWARSHGFKPAVVAALLSGRTQGNWGEAYDAAIALGLRPAPMLNEMHPLSECQESARVSGQGSVTMT
jgi:gp16 family phage-associated protein